jgi:catechol 2,3-dioxygenase-like lactoylglutathione lyase family enzyme
VKPELTHICLHVENLQQSRDFYRRYCLLQVIDDCSDQGNGSIYMSESGQSGSIVFQLKSGSKPRKLTETEESHLGFIVDSRKAVDEIAAMAEEDKILFFEAGEYLPGAYLCGVEDPNGNCIEFGFNHPIPPVR